MTINEDDVLHILDVEISLSDITPHLDLAKLIVSEDLAGSSHSAARLDEITRWLAAHLVSIEHPQVSQERFGSLSQTYDVPFTQSLDALDTTRYGRHVKFLDTSGVLAKMSKTTQRPWLTVVSEYDDA